jgi:hypothetical protein
MDSKASQKVLIELSAVIVAVSDGEPQVMLLPDRSLPSGPFGTRHRTLEQGLRAWVEAQSGLKLGYVEQLYTFADKNRMEADRRVVSIGYLALVRAPLGKASGKTAGLSAMPWYDFFPWEDRRKGVPQQVTGKIIARLAVWARSAPDAAARRARAVRIQINFPKDPRAWNEELVLQRYELLWESGLLEEARRDLKKTKDDNFLSVAMPGDHRRILATGMARLRAKIKYRPVVFELMFERFTLLQLQHTVEALAGLKLHKQNFRRLVQGQGLVVEASGHVRDTRGRPAKLFAFRREVLRERAVAGTKLPRGG